MGYMLLKKNISKKYFRQLYRGCKIATFKKFLSSILFELFPCARALLFDNPDTDKHIFMLCSKTIKVKIFSKVIASCYRRRLQNKKNSKHVKKKLWPRGPRALW